MKKLTLIILVISALYGGALIAQGIVISNPSGGGGTTIINNVTNTTTTAGSFIESGGQVVWVTGYQFRVSAATYYINNTQYTSPESTVTLDAADVTDRFDVIAVNDSNTVIVIKGTATTNPSEPTVDPGSQVKLALVSIPASSSQPSGITTTLLYCDNAGGPTEWNWTTSGSGVVVNSSTSPQAPCTKTIDATNITSGSYAQGTIPSGSFDSSTATFLVFAIRSKAVWNNKRGIQVGLYNANDVLQGSLVTILRSGSFGFDSNVTGSYQQIAIPISLFNIPASSTITKVRLIDFGGSIGFYIGKIYFQGGAIVNQPYTLPSNCTTGSVRQSRNNVINCAPQFLVDGLGQVSIGGTSFNTNTVLTIRYPSTVGTHDLINGYNGTQRITLQSGFDSETDFVIGSSTNTTFGFMTNGSKRAFFDSSGTFRLLHSGAITKSNLMLMAGTDPSNGHYQGIGFGYPNATSYTPGVFAFQTTTTSGNEWGDFVFFTRSVNTDTAPTEALRILSDHTINIDNLKSTGAAAGKNVVCVDTTTGKLYASSSGTDCSN